MPPHLGVILGKFPRTYVRGFSQNASFACLKSSSRSLESLIHPRTHVRGSSKVVLESTVESWYFPFSSSTTVPSQRGTRTR